MQKQIVLSTSPAVAANENLLKQEIAEALSLPSSSAFHVRIHKRSIDARGRTIKINLTLNVFIDELPAEQDFSVQYKDADAKKTVAIIGAGPAGLFAALNLLEKGIKPVIF